MAPASDPPSVGLAFVLESKCKNMPFRNLVSTAQPNVFMGFATTLALRLNERNELCLKIAEITQVRAKCFSRSKSGSHERPV